MKVMMRYLTTVLFMMSVSALANYFYMDKTYSDILIKNPIYGALNVAPSGSVPKDLNRFALTSEKKPVEEGQKIDEVLYPKTVIDFSGNGNFTYIIQVGPHESNTLSGKWRVENSTLIFTFDNDSYLPIYEKDTQLRYYVVKVKNPASTALLFSALSFPDGVGIISGSDSPLDDFKRIYTEIELAGNLKRQNRQQMQK